ncbi:4'-phosphopantetheinyl transferase superfamily protein [Aquibacillus sp. 3ASR75-11]|uniref:4'-phosphopantetheinyl transferase superfamily protein n=1 Tax=Terrihalobacillus insolitus TaxID=2950438 RepID=A0A9X4ALP1_9BACI|nr:4'-phosphopantetheinyl transferase superfamily protein [Terrihalobacillus insolitus]MDC3412618.1 4'-phosphopantetheinyl transferase superfamily protein [Terrihalobacillus insolitus]MDC3423969.1 4'-phosphopantetheinyl transferase superfamily protein [Terrihalobacillus insolitus]
MVTIYAVNSKHKLSYTFYRKAIKKIPGSEISRLQKYHHPQDRNNSLLGLLLSQKLNEDYLKQPVEISRDDKNRPYISNPYQFGGDFNISHSNFWVICSITKDGKVGVDIEKRLRTDLSISKEFMSNEELKQFNKLVPKDQQDIFYKLWTLKESFVKATGEGIKYPMKNITFDIPLLLKNKICVKSNYRQFLDWGFENYYLGSDYQVSLCSNNRFFPSRIKIVLQQSLID